MFGPQSEDNEAEVSQTSECRREVAFKADPCLGIDRRFERSYVELRDDQQIQQYIDCESCRCNDERHIRVIESSSCIANGVLDCSTQNRERADSDIFQARTTHFLGHESGGKLLSSSENDDADQQAQNTLEEDQGLRQADPR